MLKLNLVLPQLGLDWGILDGGGVTALLGRDVFDYIIGADVFYDTAREYS